MNKWTLASLRAKAEQIDYINKDGEAYKGLMTLFDATSKEDLEALAGAGIKWFSTMAKNRLAA